MLRLYEYPNSVCCQKVNLALIEKNLNWESITVNLGKNEHYSQNPTIAAEQIATSHGVPIAGQQMVGPDLRIAQALKQQGGGVLPAEYYGGNSGRYFENPAPSSSEFAYGGYHPVSHGVIDADGNGG